MPLLINCCRTVFDSGFDFQSDEQPSSGLRDWHFLGPLRCCGMEPRTLICAVGAIIGRSAGRPGTECSNAEIQRDLISEQTKAGLASARARRRKGVLISR